MCRDKYVACEKVTQMAFFKSKLLNYSVKIEERLLDIFKTYIKTMNLNRIQYAHFLSILVLMEKNIKFSFTILI